MKRPREPEDSGFPDAEEPAADSGMSAPTAKLPELDLAQPEVNITWVNVPSPALSKDATKKRTATEQDDFT
ncbi:hypothetical protein P8C59_003829 [Phyllachora maydis]|uniref:Uncharacterized protein n=1 Tax=Phyllachora maydis TaxID=1825666 RepID=A0AAD9I2Q8_9PEZI|nr:hypothetical protein P8C59_003829 [Phyllachora maydis]